MSVNNNPQIDPRATYAVEGQKGTHAIDNETASAVNALAAKLAQAGVPEGRYELALDSKGEVQLVNFEGVDKSEDSKRSSLLNRFVNYVKTPEFKRAALKTAIVALVALAAGAVAYSLALGPVWTGGAAYIAGLASAVMVWDCNGPEKNKKPIEKGTQLPNFEAQKRAYEKSQQVDASRILQEVVPPVVDDNRYDPQVLASLMRPAESNERSQQEDAVN